VKGRKVVVTGLGAICPLGNNVKDAWDGILSSKSGIRPIDSFDTSKYKTKIAGTIKGFNPTDYFTRKESSRIDPFIQYGFAAASQAFEDSGIEIVESNAARIGTAIGSGVGALASFEDSHNNLLNSGPGRISPFFLFGAITNMLSGFVSMKYGLKGPSYSVTTACSSGTHCIGMAARNIAYGDADIMIAGASENASTPLGVASFCATRALSTRNDSPQTASRPWDRDRDGFVLGDGAGIVVLEEYEHAKKRGANIYAEISGFGMSSDAFHIAIPPLEGDGAQTAIINAIKDTDISTSDIDYINAHGTSTLAGDPAESIAVERVLGIAAKDVLMSSTKSMTGHLIGAAGAVEAVFTILSIRDQVAPATINLDNPDENCRLDYVPHTARDCKIDVAMSNSCGFGGTNACLVFKRV
jgi:3-oxoacyl-[acyl-carrier-protein] synthase II